MRPRLYPASSSTSSSISYYDTAIWAMFSNASSHDILSTTPSIPFVSTLFLGMPTFQGPRSMSSKEGSDDGFANVLLAWYQSGYYMGRIQTHKKLRKLKWFA
ncbi:hypothetical protein PsorP6_003887 [Peronosclerospora sorghi]|uniref:Uncharacterized protein n=1 Tax=Peronosclerospora sorghi TaxID=230839 RepID=A0ACC0VPV4_9STRA|nr:hypothetical protein PsorP6_003887 [Peronosclerospora sorghi]